MARSAGVGVKWGGPTSNKGFSQSGAGVECGGHNIVSAITGDICRVGPPYRTETVQEASTRGPERKTARRKLERIRICGATQENSDIPREEQVRDTPQVRSRLRSTSAKCPVGRSDESPRLKQPQVGVQICPALTAKRLRGEETNFKREHKPQSRGHRRS